MKKVMFLAIAFVLVFQVAAFAETKIGVFNMQLSCFNVTMAKPLLQS